MTTRQHSSFAIVFILGLLAMLMPLSIDMYLPALPVISAQFGVPAGSAQMTLSTYILGFALGQLIYNRWRIASGVSRSSGRDAGICCCGGRLCVGADYRSTDRDAFLSRFGGCGGKRRHQCADAGYLSKGRVFAHDVICHAGHYDSAVNGAHCRRLGVGMVKLALYLLDTGHCGDSGVSHDLCSD